MQTDLKPEEATMVFGALDFSRKTVGETMTPIENVFMLDVRLVHWGQFLIEIE